MVVLGAGRFLGANEELRVGVAATFGALGVFWVTPGLNMEATGEDACLALRSFELPDARNEEREGVLSAQLLSRCALMSRSATEREQTGLRRVSGMCARECGRCLPCDWASGEVKWRCVGGLCLT